MTRGERLDGLAVADVDHIGFDGIAGQRTDLGCRDIETLALTGGDDDGGAGRRQTLGDRPPETGATTGDERSAAGEEVSRERVRHASSSTASPR